jgi:hypothetical protein
MRRDPKSTVLVTFVALVILIAIGCKKRNLESIIANITPAAGDTTTPGGTITLNATATDVDGDPLTYKWMTTAGTLSDTMGESTIWTAPVNPVTCTLTLIVTDDDDCEARKSKVIWAQPRAGDDVETVCFADMVSLPKVGTAVAECDLSRLPAGALVDSVKMVELCLEPEMLDGTLLDVWLFSPTDSVSVWSREARYFELKQRWLPTLIDKPACGEWKLKVERDEPTGEDGYTDGCDLNIYYRH